MQTVMILRGLPGCGKSTYARELLRKESRRWKRVNRDDLRNMMDDGTFNSDREEFIRAIQDQLILRALRDGYDVIVDNTHLVPQTLRKLHRLLASVGDVKVIEKCFNVPIDECKKRNAQREGKARVPDNVIDGMAKGAGLNRGRVLEDKEFYYPREQTIGKYNANDALPRAILVDLDGTVALLNGRNPFDASHCDDDLPNVPVIECVKAMFAAGYKIIFMSGREDKYREPTMRFIVKHFSDIDANFLVNGFELHMRLTGDSRKDFIVKEELLDMYVFAKYNIVFALDDRNSVVDHYRSLGLTVMQVAEGNF